MTSFVNVGRCFSIGVDFFSSSSLDEYFDDVISVDYCSMLLRDGLFGLALSTAFMGRGKTISV